MKSTLLAAWLLFFVFSAGVAEAATSLNILTRTGNEKSVAASGLRTITFSPGNMSLNYLNGSTESLLLADVRKLYFLPSDSRVKNVSSGTTVSVWPNPVSQTLHFENLPENVQVVTVWNITGQKVLSARIQPGNATLEVGNLPAGLYLLRLNQQTIRLSKQ